MRDRARVVIVGGGVGGTSVAYHLAQLGWTDVVLVERDQLTSGSTFHSAGLVGQLRGSVTLTSMMMYGTELYRRLHADTGHDPGWHEVGSLRLASTPERLEELRRQAGWAKTFGLPLELVSTAEAAALFQGWFDPAGVLGAVWLPTDGWLNPSDLTMALAAGARAAGVEIATGTRVTAHRRRHGERAVRPPPRHPRRRRHRRRPGANRVRGRRQRRRNVRPRDRPTGRRGGAGRADGPPVRHHPPPGAGATEPADDARPRSPRLLPRGGRRDDHGRLRARSGAVVRLGRDPRHLQQPTPRPRLGPLPPTDRGCADARARSGRRRRAPARQRPGGVHARRRVHPRRERGGRVLRGGRLLRPRHRRSRRQREGDRRVDRRWRTAR